MASPLASPGTVSPMKSFASPRVGSSRQPPQHLGVRHGRRQEKQLVRHRLGAQLGEEVILRRSYRSPDAAFAQFCCRHE